MSLGAWIIIVLALGIILSNIMLLKKTANMKMPTKSKPDAGNNPQQQDQWQKDDWDKDNWGKDDWDKENWEDDTAQNSDKKSEDNKK
ncbi:DUF2897 family protein [Aliidiomarina haloalkalitolerans]|uniref:DUF2897 domain-containing protein n=1 Tax=Aliidiomarina haloalkalitolerans TaxID=859059 RepID=A0A432VYY9_9GAMM|nr:DUF2897 family protein [Aliidiomarina haloalkalitolerans]RUO21876.1 hypothetical protein CWE06_03255 [Aliidiomarina haloalkalitolerans]